MTTNAERQRRHRRHKAGDHSLCHPDRCDGVTEPAVTAPVTPFGERGRRLWTDEGGDGLTGGRRQLLAEACRIADRLDRLDALLSGSAEDWLGFIESRGYPDRQEVVIDKPLAEARQQAVALKQILAEFRQGAAGKPETGGSALDQLAARRAARLANTAG